MFFKLVGDNLDQASRYVVRPSDRVLSFLQHTTCEGSNHHSSSTTVVNPDTVDLNQYLPSSEDYHIITSNMVMLMSRVLVKHIPSLLPYASVVETSLLKGDHTEVHSGKHHSIHHFSSNKEMYSTSLGLTWSYLENENKTDKMVDILDNHVSSEESTQEFLIALGKVFSLNVY